MSKLLAILLLLTAPVAWALTTSVPTLSFSTGTVYINGASMRFPGTLGVYPSSGDTDSCFMSLTPNAYNHPTASSVVWQPLTGLTSVTVASSISLMSPVEAIECMRVGGSGTDSADYVGGY